MKKNRNYITTLDSRYIQQQDALKRICKEFHLTCYKPDYHAIGKDCNTLLIYHNDDHDYNMNLEKSGQYDPKYRDYVVAIANTDANGNFDLNFMNYGKIDLRHGNCMEKIREYLAHFILE